MYISSLSILTSHGVFHTSVCGLTFLDDETISVSETCYPFREKDQIKLLYYSSKVEGLETIVLSDDIESVIDELESNKFRVIDRRLFTLFLSLLRSLIIPSRLGLTSFEAELLANRELSKSMKDRVVLSQSPVAARIYSVKS